VGPAWQEGYFCPYAATVFVLSEGMTGIEPALSAWEAEVLPLNYIPGRPFGARPA
jgi:hypothetical protein